MSDIIFEGSAVGVSFEPARSNLITAEFMDETDLTLEHVKNNPYDDWAVAICANSNRVGWVPKPHNRTVLRYGLDRVSIKFIKWNTFDGEVQGLSVRIGREY